MTHWRIALAGLAVAGYALLSYLLMTHAPQAPWAVAVILGPLLAAGFGWALRERHGPSLAAAGVAAATLAGVVLRGGVGGIDRLYVLQHAGIHFALGVSFAASLRAPPGRSLIGLFASRVHALTPAMQRYTHAVTRVWAGYFFAMTAASLLIYAFCSWHAWTVFGNLVTPVSAIALFVGEHRLRYVLHPEFERTTLAQGLHAWQQSSPRGGSGGR